VGFSVSVTATVAAAVTRRSGMNVRLAEEWLEYRSTRRRDVKVEMYADGISPGSRASTEADYRCMRMTSWGTSVVVWRGVVWPLPGRGKAAWS
jgi:hypothetical protein